MDGGTSESFLFFFHKKKPKKWKLIFIKNTDLFLNAGQTSTILNLNYTNKSIMKAILIDKGIMVMIIIYNCKIDDTFVNHISKSDIFE